MPTPAASPIPEHMHSITTQLWFNGNCKEAMDFYERAFEAKPLMAPMMSEDGTKVMHVMMQLGDSQIMMADAWPGSWERGPKDGATGGVYLYVDDCDATFAKAVEQGCEVSMQLMDTFWGDRWGRIKDPFGHCWGIATQKLLMTPEEIEAGQKEWLSSVKKG